MAEEQQAKQNLIIIIKLLHLALLAIGVVLISFGAWMLLEPAGLIVGGALMIALALPTGKSSGLDEL